MSRKENLQTTLSGGLRIRGHHLLCILGFRGLGYNEHFTANMTRIVNFIRSKPKTLLLVTDSADVICDVCPHLSAAGCSRGKKKTVGTGGGKRDRVVLKLLDLAPETLISAEQVYALIRARITPAIMVGQACAGCSWVELGYCTEGLKELLRLHA